MNKEDLLTIIAVIIFLAILFVVGWVAIVLAAFYKLWQLLGIAFDSVLALFR